MKRNYITKCLVFVFLTIASLINAEDPLPCGNYKIDTDAELKAMQFRLGSGNRFASINEIGNINYLVRVYFHIVTNDDGTNAPITTDQIAVEYSTLLNSYSSNNICFLNAGTDIVKNTFLNTLFNADNDPEGTFFAPYQVPNCINVFYTQKINGNNNACNPPCGIGGIALGGIPGTFCLVGKSNIGKGLTISHEVGHCLGLLHTFETSKGFENINGSNATTSGDRLSDTPADPFAYNGNGCFSFGANQCTYTGNCADSNGAKNFTPPYNNLMSYWWNGKDVNSFYVNCYPALIITGGQYGRVKNFLGSYIPLIGCSSADDVTQSGIAVSNGYYMNSAINTFTTSGTVEFSGPTKATIGGTTVFLMNGFHANPNNDGIVRIEAKPCN
jgi:hypothetical protein